MKRTQAYVRPDLLGSLVLAIAATALAPVALFGITAHAVGLNDSGQSACYSVAGAQIACVTGADDGRYGRDAAAAASALNKTGAGAAGFDFTKIANNGSVLPADTALGSNPSDWACTLDNITGLMWEMKTANAADLRYGGHTYTWYSTAATNGGNAGSPGTNTCNGTLAAFSNQCNTANYAAGVNAAALCGYADWRMPKLKELHGLVNFGTGTPMVDVSYFPNTQGNFHWSASNHAPDPTNAWDVNFSNGRSRPDPKTGAYAVRLVRGTP